MFWKKREGVRRAKNPGGSDSLAQAVGNTGPVIRIVMERMKLDMQRF